MAVNETILVDTIVYASHVYLGIVIMIGLGGNLLCVLMFASKSLRQRSPSQYLAALAIADIGVLFTVLCTWLKRYDVPVYNNSWSCKLINYMSYNCSFLSAWLIVAFTFERFVIVYYPLYRNAICTVTRARMIVASLVVLSMLGNTWVIVGSEYRDGSCGKTSWNSTGAVAEANELFLLIFTALDHVFTLFVPLCLIAILNGAIAWQIARSSKLRQALSLDLYHMGLQNSKIMEQATTHGARSRNPQHSLEAFEAAYIRRVSMDPLLTQKTMKRIARAGIMKKKQSWIKRYNERRITVVLVTVSMCYLLLNFPQAIVRLITATTPNAAEFKEKPWFMICTVMCMMLFYTQYSINFFLYSCQGRLYRNIACVRQTIRVSRVLKSHVSTSKPGRISNTHLRHRLSLLSETHLPYMVNIFPQTSPMRRSPVLSEDLSSGQELHVVQHHVSRAPISGLRTATTKVEPDITGLAPATSVNRQLY